MLAPEETSRGRRRISPTTTAVPPPRPISRRRAHSLRRASYSFPHLTSALSGDSLSGPAPANEACRQRILCLTSAKPPAAATNHRPLQATPQQGVVHRGISGGGGGTLDAMPSANGFWNPV
ncbi:hypothetical protein CH63R_03018 [Colletotrichum higginsianum IMI 349063]|uniref:Uncharacterized protein n=1 Tax=Colletotrichum higginsianum (strain IMI 349063) TaxID=759273 RepID=A0A1B7YQR3_COLHI|nr:hypothetical protein CH63R_03018 [Colletotrichum higginsianum IMI 349063]OBR14292.1 hypothetical protein CH63R_03018 [Colletotrichum higginsianum IMI 349063]